MTPIYVIERVLQPGTGKETRHMPQRAVLREPVVITGMGLIASVGQDRESVWQAVRQGRSNFRFLRGLRGIPDDQFIGATVDLERPRSGQHKAILLSERAADEAVRDAQLDLSRVDPESFGCTLSGFFGDAGWFEEKYGAAASRGAGSVPWWHQWLPNTACSLVAEKYRCWGPRLSHSTACASSLISVMSAVNAIRDRQCDIALAGGADVICPIFVAGFHQMRVLAVDDEPNRACRPFDRSRKGFVFGEGAAVFVVERLGHALRRGARIYAEISAVKSLAQAHHVTGIDSDSETLAYLISAALSQAGLDPGEIGYVNAHGTGTEQNDAAEARGLRAALGPAADQVCVSATKSILGHMINAAGAVELAVTALALRDGFAPPTMNLTDPDPLCSFDCLPLTGRINRFQHALKLSLAFGGHLVAVILSRWNDAATGYGYPALAKAA
jgi:3-oxoacyl-(acyl-carrier-protein) synthase